MNRKKKRSNRGRGRPRIVTPVPLAQPLLVKRKNSPPSPPPTKYQRTEGPDSKAKLRKTTIEQKLQDKVEEQQLRDRLQKELEYLSIQDSNLFDYDPFGEKLDDTPHTPVRLKKRKRKKSVEPVFTEFVAESDVEEEHSPQILVSQPIEELSINVPPLDEITLPDVLKTSVDLTHDNYLQAERDAKTIQRVVSLRKQNLWTPRRIPRIPPPPRAKTHWDYMLDEMVWMATDFRQERKMKIVQAKRLVRAVARKHKEKVQIEENKQKEERSEILRVASGIARHVMTFWDKIEQIVKHKHEAKLEEKMQEARGQQLEFLVGQTERYSSKLAVDLRPLDQRGEKGDTNGTTSTNSPDKQEKSQEDPAATVSTVPTTSDPASTSDSPNTEKQNEMAMEEATTENPEEVSEQDAEQEGRKEIINKAAEYATKHQPTGTTLSTTAIKTKIPSLLRGTLREYQHIGLDWLVSMYEAKLNGILADEMGLGKTIMTISLLAHLASERGIWGPHLIVVPTSVMLNWERELKRWCPGLKVITYFGSQKERKLKRHGWSKPNSFHVCITSYNLVSQDRVVLSRKKWVYLILDEAQNIKNFRSQRWQVLLNFNTRRRLLLTGTPLQNNLMELWSLMHFLMPHIFQSHSDFKEWFCNPVNNMIEGSAEMNEQLISRLHGVLRPFILRRLKKDVEKQLPNKYEHVVPCNLSKRQRFLYDEFMSRGKTQESLASGNYLSVLNVLMQLRKVCNHPDLFEERSISSPLQIAPISLRSPSLVWQIFEKPSHRRERLTGGFLEPSFADNACGLDSFYFKNVDELMADPKNILKLQQLSKNAEASVVLPSRRSLLGHNPELLPFHQLRQERAQQQEKETLQHFCYLNQVRHRTRVPLFGTSLRELLTIPSPLQQLYPLSKAGKYLEYSSTLRSCVLSYKERLQRGLPVIDRYSCYIPPVQASIVDINCSATVHESFEQNKEIAADLATPFCNILYPALKHRQLALPEKRLVQFDCGKLQKLATLLRNLKAGHHRVLIFTQMTRMLDILEIFLNLHGYTYMRLDGATKPEQRQASMERFNADDRIFAFILSTRSGGCGVNLIGADTVVFYDSDWNPAMDQQAQDRCHRIGQTREVHIYRLISKQTIEENILKKANQKRMLEGVAIEGGKFTTDFFQNVDITTFVSSDSGDNVSREQLQRAMAEVEDESDVLAMREAQKEIDADYAEFNEEANPNANSIDVETEFIKSKLTDIQKYAYRFLEEVVPVVDAEELDSLHTMVEDQAEQWKRDTLKRIKETENKMDDGEKLVYEVAGPVATTVRAYVDGSMKQYGPPVPPPALNGANAEVKGTQPLYPGHIYVHPFDYDPDNFEDSLFSEYPDLFDWMRVPEEPKAPVETVGRKRKRSVSRDVEKSEKKRQRKDKKVREPSPTVRKKTSRSATTENLFSYKTGTRKAVTGSRSRKRTVDESLLVRVPFTLEEDKIITEFASTFGGNWELISDVLNSSLFQICYRTAAQVSHHFHTNLSPYKSKKNSRKGQPAPSSAPEAEYRAESSNYDQMFESLLDTVQRVINEKQQTPTTCTEPHESHSTVLKSLGVSFGVTPSDVIRLQQKRMATAPAPPVSSTPYPGAPSTGNHPPHSGSVVSLSSLNTAQATSNITGNLPVVNISSMPSQNSPRSPLMPPKIPHNTFSRSNVSYSKPTKAKPKPQSK